MAVNGGNRSAHFPAIEKKHGRPAKYWLKLLADLGEAKYAEQIAFLRERHGFSQVHANALVMTVRGSTSSRRFETPADYLKTLDATKAKTIKAIFATIKKKFPQLESVIAWNQPMLRLGTSYIFGVSAMKNHILIAPFSSEIIKSFEKRLVGLETNKKTIRVPVDWKVDSKLLHDMVAAQLKNRKPQVVAKPKAKKGRSRGGATS